MSGLQLNYILAGHKTNRKQLKLKIIWKQLSSRDVVIQKLLVGLLYNYRSRCSEALRTKKISTKFNDQPENRTNLMNKVIMLKIITTYSYRVLLWSSWRHSHLYDNYPQTNHCQSINFKRLYLAVKIDHLPNKYQGCAGSSIYRMKGLPNHL